MIVNNLWRKAPLLPRSTGLHNDTKAEFPATPEPPYYAVIFTSLRSDAEEGYSEVAIRMQELVALQPGFLGYESARGADGVGITVSYWESLEAITAWRNQAEHRAAQAKGRAVWYTRYAVRIAKVERAYSGEA